MAPPTDVKSSLACTPPFKRALLTTSASGPPLCASVHSKFAQLDGPNRNVMPTLYVSTLLTDAAASLATSPPLRDAPQTVHATGIGTPSSALKCAASATRQPLHVTGPRSNPTNFVVSGTMPINVVHVLALRTVPTHPIASLIHTASSPSMVLGQKRVWHAAATSTGIAPAVLQARIASGTSGLSPRNARAPATK